VSLISGYDSLVNQVGAVMVGANHSMIHYNVNGHAVIVGGSTCLIAGARSSIIGSRSSEIGAASSFSTIVSADNCEIQGSNYCLVAGLNVNVNTGSHNSFVVARNAEIDHSGSIMFGSGLNSVYPGGMVRGGQTFIENNDGILADFVQNRRTTDATTQNPTGGGWDLDDTKVTSGTMRVTVHAQQDGSADGDNSGNYEVSSWAADIGFRWDGTNGYLYDDTTTAGPSTNPVLNIKQIRDGIGVAAVPQLKINTGSLRVTVTGAASKTINFLVHIQAISTLTS
jgi:hypothetical protein